MKVLTARISPFMVLYEWFRLTLPPLLLVATFVQSASASELLRPSNYIPVGIEVAELSFKFTLSPSSERLNRAAMSRRGMLHFRSTGLPIRSRTAIGSSNSMRGG